MLQSFKIKSYWKIAIYTAFLAGMMLILIWKWSFILGSIMPSTICKKELLPGVCSYPANLLKQLQTQRQKKGKHYSPRTRHLKNGKALFTNRLLLENSPYLLQHAHNPVNWYPWGEEAFRVARKSNRPVLLSVGYSTCHWCHVMEEESFEDLEIARFLNKHYVAIKVDKEERPDIDAVYMGAVNLITGRGGWPMTVWLTPDKKAFYGGTYFPPRAGDRGSSIGFLPLLKQLHNMYHNEPAVVSKEAGKIHLMVQKMLTPQIPEKKMQWIPSPDVFDDLYKHITIRFDAINGGIKGEPKFQSSFPLRLLLRYYLKTKNPDVLEKVNTSFFGMLKGGIRDHIGGGFHRYSTDAKWLVPHFEKMLYDQALLAMSYLEAYHLLGNNSYKQTAIELLNYVMQDMQSPGGGFYSATDADSIVPQTKKREEGYYFTWTLPEIDKALPPSQAQLVKAYYGVTNTGHLDGRSILHVTKPLSEVARLLNISLPEATKWLQEAKNKLLIVRNKRPKPLRDEKVLTSWNGLMISAFVQAFLSLNDPQYLKQAQKSAHFLWHNMYNKNHLYHSWKKGKAYILGYLDDYVFFTTALLDLFQVTGDVTWLKKALQLDRVLEQDFEDKKETGFFMTSPYHEALMAREKPIYDGALPSGSSIAVWNLLRLSVLTGKDSYRQRAVKVLKALGPVLYDNPMSFSEWMLALDYYHSRVFEVVLVVPDKVTSDSKKSIYEDVLFQEIRKWYLPHAVLVIARNKDVKAYANTLLTLEGKKAIEGKSTVYICEKGACQFPAQDVATLRKQLKEVQNTKFL